MSLWQRALGLRFGLALLGGLAGLVGPALLLLAARGRELPLGQLCYVALPLSSLGATAVTTLLLGVRREWQALALSGVSPSRVAVPLCTVAALAWLLLATLAPGTPSGPESSLERSYFSVPAGPEARALQGQGLILAMERIDGRSLEGAVLFEGDAAPQRLPNAKLRPSPSGAILSWTGGERALTLTPTRPLRRLRREFFRDRPITWLARPGTPLALPHLLLALVTLLGPLLLVRIAHARGALHRPRQAVTEATLALVGVAFVLFAALRLWLSR
jgi:hypothetical protein